MSQRGEQFGERPRACPFIALELDRDRRADKPDYRHRCFAEPTPQPRAIAHQEAYCLSPNFAACPIFQGWALRAAARPVPVSPGNEGRASKPPTPLPAGDEPDAPAADQPALPPDVAPVVPAPDEGWPAETFSPTPPVDAPAQLAAFDTEPAPATPSVSASQSEQEFGDTWSAAGAAAAAPAFLQGPDAAAPDAAAQDAPAQAAAPQDALPGRAAADDDEAPVPEFLAGRKERAPAAQPASSRPELPFRETVTREDVVPSWDLTDKYGADLNDKRGRRRGPLDDADRGGGDRLGGLLTTIAVIAILGLGVAGVIFLPGMLAGRPQTSPTPAITVPPSGLASPTLPVSTVTPIATVGPTLAPTAAPSPDVTPQTYRVKPGDSLGKIAQRFKVTIADILAANPQISNPDHIVPGQVITIPPKSGS